MQSHILIILLANAYLALNKIKENKYEEEDMFS